MPLTTGFFALSVFVLMLYTLFVAQHLGRLRFRAVSQRTVDPRVFIENGSLEGQSPELVIAARHFANQFELPVLFYAVSVLVLTLGTPSWIDVGLAWAFVVLRLLHGFIHLGKNDVRSRFRVFVLGYGVLSLLILSQCVSLVIRLVGATE